MAHALILFGAGASAGCGPVVPERPALGSELYSRLRSLYPQSWGALPPETRTAFGINFERGMAVVHEKHAGAIQVLMQHLALYFAQFRSPVSGRTTYTRLADSIRNADVVDRVIFSSLNYECLLEQSLSVAGFQVDYGFGGHVSAVGSALTLKIHGSCNFLPVGISGPVGAIAIGAGASIDLPVRAVGDLNEAVKHALTNPLQPVMCLYMEGKPTQVAPGTIRALQAMWQDRVADAAVTIVIGVHPNPQDTHVWDFLAASPGLVGYVGPAKAAFEAWAAGTSLGGRAVYLSDRFDTSVDEVVRLIVEHV